MKLRQFFPTVLVILGFSMLFVSVVRAQEATAAPAMSLDIFGQAGIAAMVIPFVIGALKKFAKLPTGWCPVVAFVLGSGIGYLAYVLHMAAGLTLIQALLAGAAIGGTSTGLYDLKKKLQELSGA